MMFAWVFQKRVGNVAYGVSKAATDKMTADMAVELQGHNVAVVSLYPGLVRTEKVMEAAAWIDMTNSESPEFIGRAIAAVSWRSRGSWTPFSDGTEKAASDFAGHSLAKPLAAHVAGSN